jgi:hypothetical protein
VQQQAEEHAAVEHPDGGGVEDDVGEVHGVYGLSSVAEPSSIAPRLYISMSMVLPDM